LYIIYKGVERHKKYRQQFFSHPDYNRRLGNFTRSAQKTLRS